MALIACALLVLLLVIPSTSCVKLADDELKVYRDRVVEMFQHAYDSYMQHAYPYDELRPLSCDGVNTWGSFSLTLIDALDTLAVMGNYSEFRRVAAMIAEKMDFNININVSVFETNIRVVGGLLSAHLLSRRAGVEVEPGWPCSGPLLRLAEDVANRLLPAFATKTGMPYGTVNLVTGVPRGETSVTCTAGVGTFLLEFATLSRLTGNPVFERTALRALRALWKARSTIGLVGNHIDVQTGRWTAVDAGIGAGVDSYFEYLVKGAIMLQMPELVRMFKAYKGAIGKHMRRDDWFFWVSMSTGQVTMPVFQSLEAFWPGLLTLTGDLDGARKSLYNYHQVWRQYGFTPEFYDVVHSQVNSKRDGYPLRPELVESVMYLYQATKDPHLLEIGVDILESIAHSARTECGYATIRKVQDHELEDRMESFFLAETTKYLYLLFTPDHFIHNNGSQATVVQTSSGQCVLDAGGYVFNTEAHPIDVAAVHCCSTQKVAEDTALERLEELLDLSKLLVDERREEFVRPLAEAPGDDLEDGSTGEGSTEEVASGDTVSIGADRGVAEDGTSGRMDSVSSDSAAEVHTESIDAVGSAEDVAPGQMEFIGSDNVAEDGPSGHTDSIAASHTESVSIAEKADAQTVASDMPVAAKSDLRKPDTSTADKANIEDGSAKSVVTIAAGTGDSKTDEAMKSDTAGITGASGATVENDDSTTVASEANLFETNDRDVKAANTSTGKSIVDRVDTQHGDVSIGAADMRGTHSRPKNEVRPVPEEPTAIPVSDPGIVGVEVDQSKGAIFHADHSENHSKHSPNDRLEDHNKEQIEDHYGEYSHRPFRDSASRSENFEKHGTQMGGVADHKNSEASESGSDEAGLDSRDAGAKVEESEASQDAAMRESDLINAVQKLNHTQDNEGQRWRAEVTEIELTSESDESEFGNRTPEGVHRLPEHFRFEIAGKGGIEELKNFLANAVEQATAGLQTGENDESKIHVKLPAKPETSSSKRGKSADAAGWSALTCPSQPFTSRLAFRGEMFNVD
ncbi:unnamed protein product [Ixodes hexagonus]